MCLPEETKAQTESAHLVQALRRYATFEGIYPVGHQVDSLQVIQGVTTTEFRIVIRRNPCP